MAASLSIELGHNVSTAIGIRWLVAVLVLVHSELLL